MQSKTSSGQSRRQLQESGSCADADTIFETAKLEEPGIIGAAMLCRSLTEIKLIERRYNLGFRKCLRQYAELAVRLGVNVQKGQLLVIKAQVESAPFVRLCVEEGYRAGAGEVIVQWQDDQITNGLQLRGR